eukprot:CAMPEP_0170593518 /NCGR_PEP_ID=MMETSP0224-20130122/13492_1 /TAXON_ID=285029 /ORGANISM="Togula jolla, Strain CCCM 725" /LENGTH=152 /DNA_ID=CAMNT_0010917479 /DNA_START=105 /DNA_END=563 /DNA_ORIENTATION=-
MNNILNETIRKEQKFEKKWKEQKLKDSGGGPRRTLVGPARVSCQLNYLDQTLGLIRNPHDLAIPESERGTSPNDLLRWGVSGEEQGRHSYLKYHTKRGGPHERFGRQVTAAHEIGWTSRLVDNYASSPFARRPLIKQDFYRTMGASLSTGAL